MKAVGKLIDCISNIKNQYFLFSLVYGATIRAGFLSGTEKAPDIILFDVNPFNTGIEITDGHKSVIIPCKTFIPTKKTEVFSTTIDDQSTINIQIIQGEDQLANEKHLLGKFDLTGIPPAPKGVPQIEVTFEMDINGILEVGYLQ